MFSAGRIYIENVGLLQNISEPSFVKELGSVAFNSFIVSPMALATSYRVR